MLCLLFQSYFSIILSSYAHMLNARAPSPLFYTLIGSLSDDPGFARPDIEYFIFFDQVFDETVDVTSSWSFFYLF